MRLPPPRGPISSFVVDTLRALPPAKVALTVDGDGVADDDLHLALYLCYELHYGPIEGVDPAWEWDPALLMLRGRLERAFEDSLRDRVPLVEVAAGAVIDLLLDAMAASTAPSVARFVEEEASVEQVREFLVHRSAYQLKEADPHTWLIPRVRGSAKAALVEIQSDEYGGGRVERMHSVLFARTMAHLGLDAACGAYLDRLPGVTLATVNLVSMFGLHNRLRGAGIGHLAVFESMSSEPNARYARGLRRLGLPQAACDFFDEHVEADAVHEVIAVHDLVGGFVRDQPDLARDVLWGARCLLALDRMWSEHLLAAWTEGRSSLRTGAPSPVRV